MNMRRFIWFVAVKIEAVRAYYTNRRHKKPHAIMQLIYSELELFCNSEVDFVNFQFSEENWKENDAETAQTRRATTSRTPTAAITP